MEMQFVIDDTKTSLVSPAYISSEEEEKEVDIHSVSTEATGHQSDGSDIEVIACNPHVLIALPETIASRQMTTDISGCVDDGLPDSEDLWSGEFPPVDVELGTGSNGFGQANNCSIRQCSNLVPFVDTPLSPPLNEQCPSYGRYDYAGPNVTD